MSQFSNSDLAFFTLIQQPSAFPLFVIVVLFDNLTIVGSLKLRDNAKLSAFLAKLDITLENTQLTSLLNNLAVDSILQLESVPVSMLPTNLYVSGYRNLHNTEII